MIQFTRYVMDNGLTVLLHRDESTPLVVVNMLYKVGSKHESIRKTGLAHLFEHLMFTGTEAVPDFDLPIQRAGGENNAFTSNDITNYYSWAPSDNLEALLFMEADRMARLSLDNEEFEIQKNVVVEEFYETTIDEPYGDMWHLISGMAYHRHPYRWPVIGKRPEDVRKVSHLDAAKFYRHHYYPQNAILVVSGNFREEKARKLIKKHFGTLINPDPHSDSIPKEGVQRKQRRMTVHRKVLVQALYMAFHIPARYDKDFYACDILSDLLASGRSARLYEILVRQKKLFTAIDAYTNGTSDEGLLIIDGRLSEGVTPEEGEAAVWEILEELVIKPVEERELQKVINKCITTLVFSEYNATNIAMNLAYFESIGNADLINSEFEIYQQLTVRDIRRAAEKVFRKSNSSILYYLSANGHGANLVH